jgi:hypothetical protein
MDEPIAWFDKEMNGLKWKDGLLNCDFYDNQPFYTAPPKKEWVGLTDEEIEDLWGAPVRLMYSGHYNAILAIEAKLKEKNA